MPRNACLCDLIQALDQLASVRGLSPDCRVPLTSFTLFSLQLLQDGKIEKLEELVEKYPCAFPYWVGPFQAFFYIYDPDYAKTFLGRTGKKRDESQEPNPPKSDMQNSQAGF